MNRESDLTEELSVAIALARAAGHVIMQLYGDKEAKRKPGGSPVTAADRAADELIRRGLARAFPHDAILSEETPDAPARLGQRRVWIVDPLDGTKEYLAENGEFAVMIGLAVDSIAILGIVYLPTDGTLYSAVSGRGAYVERRGGRQERLIRDRAGIPPRMIGSRSHSDGLVDVVRARIGAPPVTRCGSVGLKCARIAEGSYDLYIHPASYLKEWDTCAPEVIVREVGGEVSDCLGEPLSYNKPDPSQSDGIVASGPGIDMAVRPLIRRTYLDSLPA